MILYQPGFVSTVIENRFIHVHHDGASQLTAATNSQIAIQHHSGERERLIRQRAVFTRSLLPQHRAYFVLFVGLLLARSLRGCINSKNQDASQCPKKLSVSRFLISLSLWERARVRARSVERKEKRNRVPRCVC